MIIDYIEFKRKYNYWRFISHLQPSPFSEDNQTIS